MDQLEIYRAQIDVLDDLLVSLLAERFKITNKVGLLKKERNDYILDLDRFGNIVKRCRALAEEKGFDPEIMNNILLTIHNESTSVMRKQRES